MNHIKRFLSLVLALLLCLSALSGAVLADDDAQAAENEPVEETAEVSVSEPAAEADVPQSETLEPDVPESLPEETEAAETDSETEDIIADTEESLPETVEPTEVIEGPVVDESEQAVASDEIELIADGVYGTVISSGSDYRISSMLSLIDKQNFNGSGITSAEAKAYVEHFLFTSNFKAIGHGVYTYPNSGNYTTTVSDGTYTRSIYGSKGCMSYCRFVSKVFYGREGSLRFSAIQSASSLKSMLQTYGQAGDHIRMGSRHSVTFLSCDDNGFYCLSYQGDSTRYIYLEYWPYSTFVAYYSGSPIGIYDANTAENSSSSGSESTETGESTLSISGAVYPSGTITYGKSFTLSGTISSNYTLTNVTAYVRDTNGTAKFTFSENPAKTSFDIQGSKLDNSFTFGTLAKGSYTYTVTATDSSGKTATLISSVFACGTPTSYTVTYNANGGSGAPSSQTKYYNEDLTLSQTVPTYAGMKFIGWASSSSATTSDYAAGAVYKDNKNITLYAVWTPTTGLQRIDGKLYYLDDSGNIKTGFITINGDTYYFDPEDGAAYMSKWLRGTFINYFAADGTMCINGIFLIDGSYYYFDEEGALISGIWFELNDHTYYAGSDGKLACGITEIDGEKYYFNNSCVQTVGFATVGNNTYYFEETDSEDDSGNSNYAEMVYGWKELNGKTYYFDDFGVMTTGWAVFSSEEFDGDNSFTEEHKYYFDTDGSLVTGWKWIGGYRYYFNKYNTEYDGAQYAIGMLMTSVDLFTDPDTGDNYCLDSEGRMQTGMQQVLGTWYYFSEDSSDLGALKNSYGWVQYSGHWYYIDSDGAALIGLCAIPDWGTFYFDSNGIMQTGWQWIDEGTGGAYYYFESTGRMHTEWLQSGSTWYYLDPSKNGAMASDEVLTIGSSKYAFKSSGAMVTGWGWLSSGCYYASKSGALQTGWVKSGSTWYYLDPSKNGAMASDEVLTIGSSKYAFKSSGAMVTGWGWLSSGCYYASSSGALQTGWVKSGSAWYYLKASQNGVMASDEVLTIGSSKYAFDSSGCMISNSGWIELNGGYYYTSDTGLVMTGWLNSGNTRYYLQPDKNGLMASDTVLKIDNADYAFKADGSLLIGWGTISSRTYYCNSDGIVQTDWIDNASTLKANKSYNASITENGAAVCYIFTPTSNYTYVLYTTGNDSVVISIYDTDGKLLASGINQIEYSMAAQTTYRITVQYAGTSKTGLIPFIFGRAYTVKYNANGGAGAPDNQTKYYKLPLVLSETEPVRDGYTFLGWASSKSANDVVYSAGDNYITNNTVTLYAVWQQNK